MSEPPAPTPAAVVLAGGRSSRMGADKAALDWHGSPLVRRVAALREPAPLVEVERAGAPPTAVRAWTLAAAVSGDPRPAGVRLNGVPVAADPQLPLVAGDRLSVDGRDG